MSDIPESNSGSNEPLVVINASDSVTGVDAEYDWIEARFGERDRDWRFISQRLMRLEPAGWKDVIDIELADGTKRTLHFDITKFCRLSGNSKTSDDDGDDSPTIGEILARNKQQKRSE